MSAAIISPMVDASAATGSSETCATHPAARCLFGCADLEWGRLRANGPMRQPAIGSPESARRLFAMLKAIHGTIAETYLLTRGISALHETLNLRFHPRSYYKPDRDLPTESWPALIAAITTLNGVITGGHRTWLDPLGRGKAPGAEAAGIEAIALSPRLGDFNEDLRIFGVDELRQPCAFSSCQRTSSASCLRQLRSRHRLFESPAPRIARG